MTQYVSALATILLALGTGLALAAEARLDTSDILAYKRSLEALNVGLTGQQIADLNWQLTLLAYGDKPSSVTDEEFAIGLMTFALEHTEAWLGRLAPYDGWTVDQIMESSP